MMTRIVFITLLLPTLMACDVVQNLGTPVGPDEETKEEVVSPPEEEVVPEEPEPVIVLEPDEARQQLADLGVQYSQRAFIEAAREGNLEVVRFFVWAGMDPNVQPYAARSVLVSDRENPTSIKHLYYAWFPGEEDDDTAIMKGAYGGHIDVVRFLMDNGADLSIENQQEQSVVMFAAAAGHLEIVQMIIDCDCHNRLYDGVDGSGEKILMYGPTNAIQWAAYNGHMEVVRTLYRHLNRGYWYTYTKPFMGFYWGVIGGHLNIVEYYLPYLRREHEIDRIISGGLGLMLAAYQNHTAIIERLLQDDVNNDFVKYRRKNWIGLNTPEGRLYFQEIRFGPLHAAIQQGHQESLRILLEHWMATYGADGRDDYGMSALHFAAAGGDLDMTKILIDNGAPVNGQSDIGMTSLMFAAEWGHVDIVTILIDKGADVSLVSAYDETALSLAYENGHDDIASMLQ